MSKTSSNIGESGVKSIRLGGMKVEDLPIAEAARVIPQIQIAEDTERQNQINNVLAKYPGQRVDYLESRIRECKQSQENMAQLAKVEQGRIQEYQGHIEMCKYRDRELAKLHEAKVAGQISEEYFRSSEKELKQQYPYIIDRLQAQVDISNESIERFGAVIRRESESISELSEKLALCKQRDMELKALGAQLATGVVKD